MANVSAFDKNNLKTIRADVDAALAAVAKKHGITLSIGRITFTGETFTTKMTAVTNSKSAPGAATVNPEEVKYAKNFIADCTFYGFKREDLGKTVQYNGKPYILVGARTPRARLPIVLRSVTGGGLLAVRQASVRV